MTTEDRRLVAALTTETYELRRALRALLTEYERVSDQFCCKPSRQAAYREAKEMAEWPAPPTSLSS